MKKLCEKAYFAKISQDTQTFSMTSQNVLLLILMKTHTHILITTLLLGRIYDPDKKLFTKLFITFVKNLHHVRDGCLAVS